MLVSMRIFGRKDGSQTPPETLEEVQPGVDQGPELAALRARLDALDHRLSLHDQELDSVEGRLKTLTVAIEEGIERVDRSERRVRAVVQRAQRRLADAGYEDEGLEAEASGLQPVNGGGGRAEGMQTVLEDLEGGDDRFDASGLPGDFSAEVLSRSRLA